MQIPLRSSSLWRVFELFWAWADVWERGVVLVCLNGGGQPECLSVLPDLFLTYLIAPLFSFLAKGLAAVSCSHRQREDPGNRCAARWPYLDHSVSWVTALVTGEERDQPWDVQVPQGWGVWGSEQGKRSFS